ncbi:hypothetical protein HELRODRAFT_193296 [Helobdella robusta]|uniref:Uncharacterized protein n=1 Tax=Helobdella robusta TaxID=6412 RepID=T1FUU6_HELRO|nr:hypothetical protein HELRODRAFT_193296 [Helobdella robusta]ESN97192.1 hypothetical protein HELRODRAFT_193296 [Helobdella robusta]
MQANRSRSRRRARRVVTKVVAVGTNNTIWVVVVSTLCAAVLTAAVVASTVAVSLKNNIATPTTSNTTTAPVAETTSTATGTTATTSTSAAVTMTMLTTSTAVSTTTSCIIDATSLYAFSSSTQSTLLNREYSVATDTNPKITFTNTTFNATLIKFSIGMGNVQFYTATAHPGEQFKQGSPVDNQYTPESVEFSGTNITFNSIDFQLTPKVSGRNINIATLFIQVYFS